MGSASEVEHHLLLARDLGFLGARTHERLTAHRAVMPAVFEGSRPRDGRPEVADVGVADPGELEPPRARSPPPCDVGTTRRISPTLRGISPTLREKARRMRVPEPTHQKLKTS